LKIIYVPGLAANVVGALEADDLRFALLSPSRDVSATDFEYPI
jgi:hypothetical protein